MISPHSEVLTLLAVELDFISGTSQYTGMFAYISSPPVLMRLTVPPMRVALVRNPAGLVLSLGFIGVLWGVFCEGVHYCIFWIIMKTYCTIPTCSRVSITSFALNPLRAVKILREHPDPLKYLSLFFFFFRAMQWLSTRDTRSLSLPRRGKCSSSRSPFLDRCIILAVWVSSTHVVATTIA